VAELQLELGEMTMDGQPSRDDAASFVGPPLLQTQRVGASAARSRDARHDEGAVPGAARRNRVRRRMAPRARSLTRKQAPPGDWGLPKHTALDRESPTGLTPQDARDGAQGAGSDADAQVLDALRVLSAALSSQHHDLGGSAPSAETESAAEGGP
jgi:hypothetical protein